MTTSETPEARLFKELSPLAALPGFAGALLLTEKLALLENQLPFSDEKVVQLATPLLELRLGLSQASRDLKFLLLRLESEQYGLIPINTGLMLIRLSNDVDLDEIRKKAFQVVKSLTPKLNAISMELIGEIFFTEKRVGLPSTQVTTTPSLGGQTVENQEPKTESADSSDPRCEEYLKKVRSLLSRVASASQTDRMFDAGFKAVGSTDGQLSAKQIANFSEVLVEGIHNPARRKMVAKEMLIVAKKLDL